MSDARDTSHDAPHGNSARPDSKPGRRHRFGFRQRAGRNSGAGAVPPFPGMPPQLAQLMAMMSMMGGGGAGGFSGFPGFPGFPGFSGGNGFPGFPGFPGAGMAAAGMMQQLPQLYFALLVWWLEVWLDYMAAMQDVMQRAVERLQEVGGSGDGTGLGSLWSDAAGDNDEPSDDREW